MLALSETFAQSAMKFDPASTQTDPDNKVLSRGPHQRLTAEEVRDQALAVSQLICRKVGGPSARPYVPPRFYRDAALQQKYDEDQGEGLYRRSMYSFWRRTLPPPDLSLFDAPSREFCVVKREQTNSPMQALTLLNDQQFVEAQRVLAERLLHQFPDSDVPRLRQAFRLFTSRLPTDAEFDVMAKMVQGERDYFQKHQDEAVALVTGNGKFPSNNSISKIEVASLAVVIRALMSHDEALNR
jgi:hypothetical protein